MGFREHFEQKPTSSLPLRNAVVYETDPTAVALASIALAGHRHVAVLGVGNTLLGIVSPRRVFDFIEKHYDS